MSSVDARLAGRIPDLDTMRGIAAVGVLVSHVAFSTGYVGTPFWGGWASRLEGFVNLFFILSGFVLFRPYAAASAGRGSWPSVRRYVVRRIFRIVPAYWAVVVVSFLTVTDGIPNPAIWLRHLTFTQYYTLMPLLPGVGMAWTLTVEVVFYALLPLVAIALLRHGWRPVRTVVILLVVGFALSIGWLSQLRPGRLDVYLHTLWFPGYAMCFAIGMALAVVSVALQTATAPRRWSVLDHLGQAPWACWAIAVGLFALSTSAAGVLGGLGIPTAGDYVAKELLFLGFSTFLLLPVIFGPRTSLDTLLSHPLLRWVGTVSYGLFLWNLWVIDVVAKARGSLWGTDVLPLLLLTLAGGLGLAALSWYTLERPAQRLGDRILTRLAASSARRHAGREPERRHGEDAEQLRHRLAVGAYEGEG
jgi:peptidoglycan/LPS O-acetylase OafA/YrhL